MSRFVFLIPVVLLCGVAHANHPMLSDDTEVLDKGAWQLELHGERLHDERGGVTTRATLASVALSYGVAKNLELQIEQPYVKADSVSGRADVQLELEWNFYERDGVGLLLKPVLSLPTGSEEVSDERAQVGLELAAAKELGDFELLANLGYASNRNDEGLRESLWRVSAALVWSASERLKLFADLARTTHPRPGEAALSEWAVGFLYDISSSLDFGLGLSQGLSDSAIDRGVRAGLRLRW